MALKVYNTLKRKKEIFKPVIPGKVRLYTCGPTVYNYAHIGNYRTYLFEDLLRRYLKSKGFEVIQVMNLTDVEDKTIKHSREQGIPLKEFTDKYIKAFFEDLESLNMEKAEFYPRATEYIPEMITLIADLVAKKVGYQTGDNCVWYSIAKFSHYGELAHLDVKTLQAGASGRVLSDEYEKEQAADFALWKAWDETDGDISWDSPWGKGRPGWHIECSAMSMKLLTDTFKDGKFDPSKFKTIDIHTGGVDNLFPHHQYELAQSEAVTGKKFVNYWMHSEHLLVDNKKMSKSLGNFYTVRDLKDKGYDLRAFRYLIMSVHYKQKLNFTLDGLVAAKEALKSMDDFIVNLGNTNAPKDCSTVEKLVQKLEKGFAKHMDDDLNVSPAFAVIFDFMKQINKIHDKLSKEDAGKIILALKKVDSVLGFMKFSTESAPADVLELVNRRENARKSKDFATADAARDKLKSMGWYVEDLPSGPRPRRIQ